jgi:hypothetical protein
VALLATTILLDVTPTTSPFQKTGYTFDYQPRGALIANSFSGLWNRQVNGYYDCCAGVVEGYCRSNPCVICCYEVSDPKAWSLVSLNAPAGSSFRHTMRFSEPPEFFSIALRGQPALADVTISPSPAWQ